jgi:hypothetical protein
MPSPAPSGASRGRRKNRRDRARHQSRRRKALSTNSTQHRTPRQRRRPTPRHNPARMRFRPLLRTQSHGAFLPYAQESGPSPRVTTNSPRLSSPAFTRLRHHPPQLNTGPKTFSLYHRRVVLRRPRHQPPLKASATLCKTSRLTGLWLLKRLDEPVEYSLGEIVLALLVLFCYCSGRVNESR